MTDVRALQKLLLKSANNHTRKVILKKIREAKRKERRETQVEELRTQIIKCRNCGLNRTRFRAVPWSGPTHGKADLLIVGEAPGADEDSKGIPFVGRSGRLLDQLLANAGTARERCFVANTLCCRPPENRDPKPRELEACTPNFRAQLEIAGGWVGVTLGGYALANVMGKERTSIRMADYLDKPVWVDGRIWIPTYHPAYALRNPREQETIIRSLKFGLALRWGTEVLPIPPGPQIEVDGKPGKDYMPRLEKYGWVLVHSTTLNCQIVIIKDDKAKIPGNLKDIPRYSFDELVQVGLAGQGRRHGWSKSALRRLHTVKVEFDGEVVMG